MIPFGCRTPILSIINHDKLGYFLEDVGHPEWGVDVEDEAFAQLLVEKTQYILNNMSLIQKQIDIVQDTFFEITKKNVIDIYNN